MPRDGSLTLSDVRSTTLSLVCEPCGSRGRYVVAKLIDEHGDAKLTDEHKLEHRLLAEAIGNDLQPSTLLDEQHWMSPP
jgi:hypothetical protein